MVSSKSSFTTPLRLTRSSFAVLLSPDPSSSPGLSPGHVAFPLGEKSLLSPNGCAAAYEACMKSDAGC